MKYKTKLYFAFISTGLLVSMTGIGYAYYMMKPRVFLNLQIKTRTVAATTAALLNVDDLKQIHDAADQKLPAYTAVREELTKARNANRRKGIWVENLYTFIPRPGGANNEIVYLVDSGEPNEEVYPPGTVDINELNVEVIKHLDTYYSPNTFVRDYADWVSGFAPIFDENDKYVATVGIDISSNRYLLYLHRLRMRMLIGFGCSFAFAIVGAALIANQVTKSLQILIRSAKEIGHGELNHETVIHSHDEFEELANEMNHMTKGLRERERLKLNFARYVSQEVMETVMGSQKGAVLNGVEKKITVLVSDIRSFTHLSENLPPERVVSLLNEYFEVMLEAITSNHGRLDKFIGDGILVEFGAPCDDIEQEKHAVLAAIGMQTALNKLRKEWPAQGKPVLHMGVGIHTGLATVGNIGTEKRLEYTAIGSTVETAFALERATKHFQRPILISESTYQAIRNEFKTTDLGAYSLFENETTAPVYGIDINLESS